MLLYANAREHRSLPEASSSQIGSQSVDDAERNDTFNWSGDDTKCQGVRVVLVPSLDVEGQESYS